MRISRFAALAAIGMLVLGGVGAVNVKASAQARPAPAAQATLQPQDCSQDASDGAEVQSATDTDSIDLQCGDQSAADTQGGASGSDPSGASVAQGDQNAPDPVERAKSVDGQDAVPTGTPAITADAAKAAAEAYLKAGTASKVELDAENGKLLYSVEIGSTDVKVDAMTGSVLGAESIQG